MSALSARRAATVSGRRLPRPDRTWLIPLTVAIVALGLAISCRAYHPNALPHVALIALGTLVLFVVTGDALSLLLTPQSWRPIRPLLTLPFGATASGMVLMAFGVAHIPLKASLWATLAIGLAASYWTRTRTNQSPKRDSAGPPTPKFAQAERVWGDQRDGATAAVWTAVLAVLFLVALIPAWRTGALTIYGQNPDSSQVVGIAILFQHVPPTHTDIALPLDVVPREWRFRYPIFYPLAAVANLVHADPIRAFPVLSAMLLVIAALGFGLMAVRCFGAPAWAGPVIAAIIGFTWILQYLTWHPYWNQLWGTTLLPYTILFGWQALERRDGRAGVACLVTLLMLWFAYPLALPYPLVILAGAVVAFWSRPKAGWWRGRVRGARGWAALVVLLCLLVPAIAGSVIKLKQAIVQLLSPHSALWGGDIKQFVSFGKFAGTGGGVVPAILVLLVASWALWRLPAGRRVRICVGVVLVVLLLLDLRFRLTHSGTYMDFKHLSFMGLVVLSLAAAGLCAEIARPGRLRWAAGFLVVVWCVAALVLDHHTAVNQNEQVTAQMFQIRRWAARLPHNASVRIDIPPNDGGLQLWAVYMLGSHPVDSYEPLLNTTYAHAAPGFRADDSLSLSVYPTTNPDAGAPFPQPAFTASPPLAENTTFVLRAIDWPAKDDSVAQTASQRLIEP